MKERMKLWFDFMGNAISLVQKGQPINNSLPIISLLIDPSFENTFHLQITWKDDKVYWYRTTWNKLSDDKKINDVIESLKYIGHDLQPEIKKEKGERSFRDIQAIIDYIDTLRLKPVLEPQGIILDGVRTTLQVGVSDITATYHWNILPQEWMDLEQLVLLIEAFNESAIATK